MKPSQDYHILFSEILNGFSLLVHSFYGDIYLKHFSYLEIGNLDSKYNSFFQQARNKGYPTYKDREEFILKEKLWTQSDESDLVSYDKMLSNLRISHSKDYLHSRRKMYKKQIEDNEQFLNRLIFKKDFYIGNTAEKWASRQLTYYKITNSYFKDLTCKEKLINNEEELDNDDIYFELIKLHNENQEKFNQETVKRLALSPFFCGIFYLSEDNAFNFYGKPIVNLTNYQVDLFQMSKYFKHILSNNPNIPAEVKSNPEELIEWITLQTNAKEQKIIGDDTKEGNMSIVGATKDDYKRLGIQISDDKKMREALRKHGGNLTKEQLFELNN